MTSPPPVRVTAAILRRAGKVLIARRRPGGHLEGLWEFPGGKIEPGETPEECLARELEEELGVRATVGRFVTATRHAYARGEIELLAYEAELEEGRWTLESHDEVRWVAADELLDHELAPADVAIAERLASGGRRGAVAKRQPAARKRS